MRKILAVLVLLATLVLTGYLGPQFPNSSAGFLGMFFTSLLLGMFGGALAGAIWGDDL